MKIVLRDNRKKLNIPDILIEDNVDSEEGQAKVDILNNQIDPGHLFYVLVD